MKTILCIETSTKACSSALCNENGLLAASFLHTGSFTHAESLNPMILELMEQSGVRFSDLSAVAVSEGPGSYTGLRIGVSSAKGICYAAGIPLIAIDTLSLMALKAARTMKEGEWVYPMIDARRMEVYTALFDHHLHKIGNTSAMLLDENSFSSIPVTQQLVLCGDGAEKCKTLFSDRENIRFADNIHPDAEEMCGLAFEKFLRSEFVDTAYFEPNYLKEFYSPAKIKHRS